MEVHHHPNTEKKKVKEYLLEFLMIFLAVTLGFFAESFREYVVNKKREKEYMQEIVSNLQYDTLRCELNAVGNISNEAGLDSLRKELKNAIAGTINTNTLYYFGRYINGFHHARFNTSAITELKNSGSLRLVKNKNIVGEIADYYERKISAAQSYEPVIPLAAAQRTGNEIFSMLDQDDIIKAYDHIDPGTYNITYDYTSLLKHQPVLKLLKSDPAELEKFYTEIAQLEIGIKNYNFWLYYCKEAAEKLIADIRKNYYLKDE